MERRSQWVRSFYAQTGSDFDTEEDYLALVREGPTGNYGKIRKDSQRTPGRDKVFAETELIRLLCALTRKLPDMLYKQEIPVPLSVFLINSSEIEAFYLMQGFVKMTPTYWLGNNGSAAAIVLLDRVLHLAAPQIYTLADRSRPQFISVTTKWFRTFFGDLRPLEAMVRLWDHMIEHGFYSNILLAAALLVTNKEAILSTQSFSSVGEHGTLHLDADAVLRQAAMLQRELPEQLIDLIRLHVSNSELCRFLWSSYEYMLPQSPSMASPSAQVSLDLSQVSYD